MTKLAFGDTVWFFQTEFGRQHPEAGTIVIPGHIRLIKGKIIHIHEMADKVRVYDEVSETLYDFGYTFGEESLFRTKEEALDCMLKNIKLIQDIVL